MICNLCPRFCAVNRSNGETGFCGQTDTVKAGRAAKHYWEEPCISGKRGSGTVFFSGCNLRCVFCQNHLISADNNGVSVSLSQLSDVFLGLMDSGANNINLVTPTHFVPQISEAIREAKSRGLDIPIVYNTGSYETTETIEKAAEFTDIFLPDLKYISTALSAVYSAAPDYFEYASKAIDEMVKAAGKPVFAGKNEKIEKGMLKKGVVIRHMMLPGCLDDSKQIVKYLFEKYGDDVFISLMNQYTPISRVSAYPEINRKVSDGEYDELIRFALDIGVRRGFIQDGETAAESFIPSFNGEGLI